MITISNKWLKPKTLRNGAESNRENTGGVSPRYLIKKIMVGSVISLLSGCGEVGPDFHSPPPPPVSRYTEKPLPKKTVSAPTSGGKSQTLVTAPDIPQQWWELFHSPNLNCLMTRGIANSPNLEAALAALREAEQNWQAGRGQLYPSIGSDFNFIRQRTSGVQFGAPGTPSATFNLYNVSFSVAYVFDVWGGVRRQIEALAAQVDYQRYQWNAAYMTLTGNIATTAITEASLRGQIAATLSLINEQEKILYIVKQQQRLGGASGANVLTQETQLAQTRATLPPLQKNLALNRDALAALVGDIPSASHLPVFRLEELTLPDQVPVSIPAEWIRQRPDVQASEALWHAASAQIGVATADMLPQITLAGNYGWVGSMIRTLFSPVNSVWSYGADIAQPIFQGGALVAKRRAAIAAYDEAAAQYRQTLLLAFQNVADALNALEIDAKTLRAQAEAENAARATFVLTRKQYRLGAVDFLTLLNAQAQYQQTRINRIQAEAARYADTAGLFQALGGGWWHVSLVT